MSHDRDHQRSRAKPGASTAVPTPAAVTAGKQTRVQAELGGVVQRRAAAAPPPLAPAEVHAAAQDGVDGATEALPHLATIQGAFGHHDVSSVRARVGGAASAASEAIGAEAYTRGETIAFRQTPDLRLAAHEAAHVVQQRGGVSVAGGVGAAGDVYERHADAVADAVVAGRSAEALLDEIAAPGAKAGAAAVQKWEDPGLETTPTDRAGEAQTSGDAGERDGAAPAGPGQTWRGRATNLRSGLRRVIAQGIAQVAGAEGSCGEMEIAVEVPIPGQEVVRVAGTLKLTVDHDADGYRLTGRPELGFSVREDGMSGRFLSQLAFDVRGHDAPTAASLIGLAMDEELRAMASEPPPSIVITAIATATGVYGVALYAVWDVSGRLGSYLARGQWDAPFYPWLADMLFGREHGHIVRQQMRDGDYAETVDGARAVGGVSDRSPDPERGGSTSLEIEGRLGQHRRVAHEDGAVQDTEYHALDVSVSFELDGWKVSGEVNQPVAGDEAPRTKYAITVGKMFEATDARLFLAADVIAAVCTRLVAEVRERSSSAQEPVRDLDRIAARAENAASLAQSFVLGHAAGVGAGGKVGASIKLDGTHGESSLGVKVKFMESIGVDLAAQGQGSAFSLRHGRVIADFDITW